MEQTAANIAENLLKIKAVKLNPHNPFTWASGLKSPIYCDNRQTLSYPVVRDEIREAFKAATIERFPMTEGIAGVATAGIPHGAILADALDMPLIYVRSKPKGHGLANLIEGKIEPDTTYLVVEDLVSTGMSSLKAVEALRAAGAHVEGLVSVFSYGFPAAQKAMDEAGVRFFSLTNLEVLLQKAVEINYIQPADLDLVKVWQNDPKAWSEKALEL